MVESINIEQTKTKYTVEEKQKLCANWQNSGLSKNVFIKMHNLPKTFYLWCNDLLESESKPKKRTSTKYTNNTNQWLRVASQFEQLPGTKHQELDSTIEFRLRCNSIDFNFCMPIRQIIMFVKELCDATTVIR